MVTAPPSTARKPRIGAFVVRACFGSISRAAASHAFQPPPSRVEHAATRPVAALVVADCRDPVRLGAGELLANVLHGRLVVAPPGLLFAKRRDAFEDRLAALIAPLVALHLRELALRQRAEAGENVGGVHRVVPRERQVVVAALAALLLALRRRALRLR